MSKMNVDNTVQNKRCKAHKTWGQACKLARFPSIQLVRRLALRDKLETCGGESSACSALGSGGKWVIHLVVSPKDALFPSNQCHMLNERLGTQGRAARMG